jgi:hypothetical protein
MTATESLLPEIINDFFNKICHKLPLLAPFDHFVGDGEQRRRALEARALAVFEIDDQLKFGRLSTGRLAGDRQASPARKPGCVIRSARPDKFGA